MPLDVFTVTTLTLVSGPGWTLRMTSVGHWSGVVRLSFNSTRSPGWRLGDDLCQRCLVCSSFCNVYYSSTEILFDYTLDFKKTCLHWLLWGNNCHLLTSEPVVSSAIFLEVFLPSARATVRSTTRNAWLSNIGYYLTKMTPEIALTSLHAA
jgi:hypothetical protein